MYLSDVKLRILAHLKHGPLDHFQIAADLSEAPFLVHAELKGLRRERLVRFTYERAGRLWELTDRGNRIAWGREQLPIEGSQDVA